MKTRMKSTSRPRNVRGMSLIEVLVAVLVLAVGLLGVAAMQALALRGGQGSLESSQAVMQTTSIIEAMRANRSNAASYNVAKTCSAASISATGLPGNDLKNWIDDLKATVGIAGDVTTCGQIVGCPTACVVTVFWDDSRAGGGSARSVVTETRI